MPVIGMIALVSLISLGVFMGKEDAITGRVTYQQLNTYNEQIDWEYPLDAKAPLEIEGNLLSFKVSGSVGSGGSAKIYLNDGLQRYLVFDSHLLEYTQEFSAQLEENVQQGEKQIALSLGYAEESIFDPDNDGIESINGVIDFSLDSSFSWDADESKLCSRWQVYNYDTENDEIVCTGNENCCIYAGHEIIGDKWYNPFYLNYGKYGSGLRNIVRAQVIYVDYNLSIENPFSEIAFSDWADSKAVFLSDKIGFSDVCIETCNVNLEGPYGIEVEVENSSLFIGNISYSLLEEVKNRAPQFLTIPDIGIDENSSYGLNLLRYAYDPDNDSIELGYIATGDEISVEIANGTAIIIPDKSYSGTSFLTFTANDTETIGISNYVRVTVYRGALPASDVKMQEFAVVGKPVRWKRTLTFNETMPRVRLNISENAVNITVKTIEDGEDVEIEEVSVSHNGEIKTLYEYETDKRLELIEKEIEELQSEKTSREKKLNEELAEINKKLAELQNEKNDVTGHSVYDIDTDWFDRLISFLFGSITGNVVAGISNANASLELIVQIPVDELIIEYETPAPEATEIIESDSTKQVVISSDEHYENILAFASIPELPVEAIALFHIENSTKTPVEIYRFIDSNNNGKIDEIQWIVPSLSNQTYEIQLEILTVQSYPIVGGTWVVDFNTVGTANLTITAANGTTYGDGAPYDLTPASLRCDNVSIAYAYNASVFFPDYSCNNKTSHYTVRVNTLGKHTQEFRFGNITKYAFNIAEQGTPRLNATDHPINSTNANLTAYNVSSINATRNIYNWFVDNESIAVLNMPFEAHEGDEFNESVDYSAYGLNGTVNSTVWSPNGGYGNSGAYSFDGGLSFIEINDTQDRLDILGNITVMAWIKPSTLLGVAPIVSRYNFTNLGETQFIFRQNAQTLQLFWSSGTDNFQTGDVLTIADKWYHVAFVYGNGNNASVKIYVNGTNVSGSWTGAPSAINASHFSMFIGKYGGQQFNGIIDELMVFNRTLPSEQIRAFASNKTNTIVSQETTLGETWWVNVTPNDGAANGNSLKSNELTIRSGPSQSTPILNATDNPFNTSAANLTVYNQSTAAEGRVKNIYNFILNNVSMTKLNLPFEAGLIKDYSGHGTNGSSYITGGFFNTTGGHDGLGAYYFSGSPDYISINDTTEIRLSSPLSVEFWVKPEVSLSGYRDMIGKGETDPTANLYLVLSGGGFVENYNSIKTTAEVELNKWYHIVYTEDGTNEKIYVNGILNVSEATQYLGNEAGKLTIGKSPQPAVAEYFQGYIDDIRIWNRSLSANQVKALYEKKPNIMVSQELSRGQTWYANVTPNDGVSDGDSLKSNELAILSSAPTHTTPILNATDSPRNSTFANLTAYNQSTFDADGDRVRNIYNWFVNNRSIAVVNLPFEGGSTNGIQGLNGTTIDYTGYNNTPIAANATWNSTGGYGGSGAYEFEGDSDYVFIRDTNNQLDISTNVTIMAWIYPQDITDTLPIVARWSENAMDYLFRTNAQQLQFFWGHDVPSYTTGNVINTANRWYHVAVTHINGQNTSTKVYVNGANVSGSWTGYGDNTVFGSAIDMLIGRYSSSYFKGKIDEVRVFNQSLSAEQIKAFFLNYTNVIVSNETISGQTWWVNVTPNDGTGDGISLKSNELTITTPPTASAIQTNNTLPHYSNVIFLNWTVADDESLSRTWLQIENGTGRFNTTPVALSGTQDRKNYTYTVADTKNVRLNFTAYVNDSLDNLGSSPLLQIIVQSAPPTHTAPVLNATDNPLNSTESNLTSYNQSTSDVDGERVTNIYNWFVNGGSIAVINLAILNNSNAYSEIIDYSGNNNNASVRGPVVFNQSGYGGRPAYDLRGNGANITINDSNSLSPFAETGHMTIMFWAYWNESYTFDPFIVSKEDSRQGSTNEYKILSNGNSWRAVYTTLEGVTVYVTDTTTQLPKNTWFHYAWVVNNATENSTVYLNGIHDGDSNRTNPTQKIMAGNSDLLLGVRGNGNPSTRANISFSGFAIYNRSLSPSQVYAIFINQSNIITGDETDSGDVWQVNITPNDGTSDGISLQSNSILIHGYANFNLTSPLNASTKTNANITFNYEINQTHINYCSLYVNKTGTFSAWVNATPLLGINNFSLILRNGGYVWNVWCNTTSNDPSYFRSNFSLTVGVPNIGVSYASPTEANNTHASRNWIFINLSISATDLANSTFSLYNASGLVNSTINDEATSFINFTNLQENMRYFYNSSLEDYAGNRNSTETRAITLDTLAPNVTLYSPTPLNGSSGSPQVTLNWSVRDNIDTILACNTTIDGAANETIATANATFQNASYVLTSGIRTLAVRCYDDAGNSNISDTRTYTVAIINISQPRHNAIFRPFDNITIGVDIVEGTTFINNVTVFVFNDSYQASNISDAQWALNYTIANITPQRINVRASGFNNNAGRQINVTSSIQLRISSAVAAAPTYQTFCANETYTMNNSNITIINEFDLDTLLDTISINITAPDGGVFSPVHLVNSSNDNFTYSVNYTYLANNTGRYTMNIAVQDIANNTIERQEFFYVSNSSKNVNFTREGFDNLTLKDICTKKAVFIKPNSITIPLNSAYDLEATNSKVLLSLRNSTFAARNNTLNFTQRTSESAPPTGQRRIDMFDLNANNSYSNLSILFNYSTFSHTLTHESNLKFYRCEDENNCVFELQNRTLNTTDKTILMELPALSRYILTEPALTTPDLLREPVINNINVSRFYAPVNETVNITVDFNTTLGLENISVTVNGTSLRAIATSNTSSNHLYTYNYTPASIGNYLINVLVIDQNTFNSTASKVFYSNSRQEFTIDAPNGRLITAYDSNNNITLGEGIPLTLNETIGRYNLEIVYNKTRVMIINASLNNSVSSVFNYSDVGEDITAPTNRINIDQFRANTSIGFDIVLFYHNYTNISSITNEGNLEVFRCESSGNCTFEEISSSIDTAKNIISFNVSSFSLFNVVESIRTETQTVTVESAAAGGGMSIVRVKEPTLVQLEITSAQIVTLAAKGTIEIPVILKNKGQVNLTEISLSSSAADPEVTSSLDKSSFERLDIGETEKTVLTLSSTDLINGTEVTLKGTVKEPSFEDSIVILVRPVIQVISIEESEAVEKLRFVGDVFEKNPECLEFKEMLELAGREIENKNYKKASELLDRTLNVCRDLVAYRKPEGRPFLGPAAVWIYQAAVIVLVMYIVLDLFYNHRSLESIRKAQEKIVRLIRRKKKRPKG